MRIVLAAAIVLMFCMNIGLFIHKVKSNEGAVNEPIAVRPVLPVPVTPIVDQPPPPQKPPAVPTFVTVETYRTTNETGSVYNDVLSHSPTAPFGDGSGRSTNVHETAHGIHSYLRNKYTFERGKRVNGFYVLEGRAVIIEEPNIRKSQINKFVPENLRSYRYQTYLVGQQAWDDTPLYIYDEWTAYVLGGKCNVDDVENGRYKGGWTDGVSGCLGFSIYAVATAMAVHEHDPAYWENNQQYRDFTIWMLQQSYETYMKGHQMEQFKWAKQDELLNELLVSAEAEKMRAFMREHLNGVWLDADYQIIPASDDHKIPPPPCQCGGHHP